MANVCQVDCSSGGGALEKNFGSNHSAVFVYVDVAFNAAALANLLTNPGSFTDFQFLEASSHTSQNCGVEWYVDTGPVAKWAAFNAFGDPASTPFTPSPALTSMQFYRVGLHVVAGSPITQTVTIDGVTIGTITATGANMADIRILDLFQPGLSAAGGLLYLDNVKVGSTDGATDIFSDDFEGGNLSNWTSADTIFSVVSNPGVAPPPSTVSGAAARSVTFTATTSGSVTPALLATGRRVGIAFNDGPLDPFPTWVWLDDVATFPAQFVAGYDTKNGRQTLISQTETGTATVYVNDRAGLFDDRNVSSPYYGNLSGKQIILQLWDPVAETWEEQFRGWIENYSYDIDGSAIANPWAAPADRQPLNASIQIECVDMFDMLSGFGLTPGLAGDRPPSGMEDGVYYPNANVQGRQIQILTDVGIPSEMRGPEDNTGTGEIAEGNVHVIAVKYDPDESALSALRDAADAEIPFIANIFIDRRGRYQFHGRYARFAPDDVAGEAGSHWDFTRWAVGDGAAIASDGSRAQMRVLSFERSRLELINAALCYPQGLAAADMPNQVFAGTGSITNYGKHDAPPMSDLLTTTPLTSGSADEKRECFLFAKLLVKNKQTPRESITSLQVKAIHPADLRAEATWAFITTSDIGHIVNVAVGYPGGTGFTGDSPADDYYIEGRGLRVRPLNPDHDYVEYTVAVSPAVWSMDTHNVFPPYYGGGSPTDVLQADFDYAEEVTPGIFDFTDESTPGTHGPITAWAWNFGDAGTSSSQNPTHTYAANGRYIVTLVVTGTSPDGTDTVTGIVLVTDL